MSQFLPLFPLNLVVYPKEKLPLHIFEPRYRQLINECLENKTTFGIPCFLDNKLKGYGTEMKVSELIQRHEDGRMDIITYGIRVFRITDFQNPLPDKLYAGGQVEYLSLDSGNDPMVAHKLIGIFEQLYDLLKIEPEVDFDDAELISFAIAHKAGLSQEQEYRLLTIESETERQEFLIEHLERAIPIIADMEKTKERIKMNGHFRSFDPLNF
jgi:hypothetical protein